MSWQNSCRRSFCLKYCKQLATGFVRTGTLRNQLSLKTPAVSVKHRLKGAADNALVVEFKLFELMQGLIVVLDQLVGRTDVEWAHMGM